MDSYHYRRVHPSYSSYQALTFRVPSPYLVRKSYMPTVEDLRDIVSDGWRRPPRPHDEVYPRIFVGGESTAEDILRLRKLGITHILNAACVDVPTGEQFYKSRLFKCSYLGIPAVDHEAFRLTPYFEEAARFIESAILTLGGRVYVHCREGISRSASLVIAYLIMRKGMGVTDAIRYVRNKRNIWPNDSFLRQLIELHEHRTNFSSRTRRYDSYL